MTSAFCLLLIRCLPFRGYAGFQAWLWRIDHILQQLKSYIICAVPTPLLLTVVICTVGLSVVMLSTRAIEWCWSEIWGISQKKNVEMRDVNEFDRAKVSPTQVSQGWQAVQDHISPSLSSSHLLRPRAPPQATSFLFFNFHQTGAHHGLLSISTIWWYHVLRISRISVAIC